MNQEEKNAWICFSAFAPIGPKRFALILKNFGSAKRAWTACEEKFRQSGFSEKLVDSFLKFREKFNLNGYLSSLKKLGIKVLTVGEKEYPENLKKIDSAPFVLYVLGEIKPEDSLALGVVGTRKITSYGKQVTENLVTNLVCSGVTIVSGLAYGVDSVAHQTAIATGGRTIGVWAGGLDSVLPGYRQNLVKIILESGRGAIVSEFPLGFHPSVSTFPQRNRIISGLSLGVLVTEAAEDSGSLITADFANKQGRKVFAVPGPITSLLTEGTAKLLKNHAKLVYNVKDILDVLEVGVRGKGLAAREILPDDKNEEIILNILKNEEKNIDQMVCETGMKIGLLTSILTMMEIKGKIKNIGGMVYTLKR